MFKNTSGDVVISGNTIRQTATINMVGTFSSFRITQIIILSLINKLLQMAKAVISGLNLAQLADANNTVDSLINNMY